MQRPSWQRAPLLQSPSREQRATSPVGSKQAPWTQTQPGIGQELSVVQE
jgi:hypothetical protein